MKKLLLSAFQLFSFSAFALAADNYVEIDSYKAGTTQNPTFRATDAAGIYTPHVIISNWPGTFNVGTGNVGGFTAVPSATFTRPADTTAYASGDLVANSTTAGSVAAMSFTVARTAAGSGMIRRVRLQTSNTSLTNASFRVHFYSASPTVSNGDNGAWLSTGAANYLGAVDVTLDKAFTDGATGNGVPAVGSEINFALASGQVIFGLLEARAAYTPASAQTFTIAAEVLQN